VNFNHVRPATLSPQARAEINAALRKSRLERIAAQMWEQAIDREDYSEASEIAAETESWFDPD
jgi:hypothetical protein